jgi:hypothetical protein
MSSDGADSAGTRTLPEGNWGGRGIRLVVASTGGQLEYDCALGTIADPIALDEQGKFTATGTHTFERGGPVSPGDPPPTAWPAAYAGCVDGGRMQLTVTRTDNGQKVGTFDLEEGKPAQLEKCL